MSFVNAGFSDEKCLNLKMTSVSSPSHFDTKVPTCDWVGPTGYVEVKGNKYYVIVGGVTAEENVIYSNNDYIKDGSVLLRRIYN